MGEKDWAAQLLECTTRVKEPQLLILALLLETMWRSIGVVYSDKFSFFIVNDDAMRAIESDDTLEFMRETSKTLYATRANLKGLERQVSRWYVDARCLAEKEIGEKSMAEFQEDGGRVLMRMLSCRCFAGMESQKERDAEWASTICLLDICKESKENMSVEAREWIGRFKREFLSSTHVEFVSRNVIYACIMPA